MQTRETAHSSEPFVRKYVVRMSLEEVHVKMSWREEGEERSTQRVLGGGRVLHDQEGEPGGGPPDGSLLLGGLQEASIVWHDLVLRQVQVELQRHQDRELEGDQFSAVHSEPLLKFVNQQLDLVLLQVSADLGGQEDAGSGAQLSVLLVQFALKNQFFKVDEGHGHRRLLVATLILGQLSDLPLQAPDLAESEPDVGEFLLEGFVHVFLEIGGFDIFNDGGHVRGEDEDSLVFSTRPLRVVQQIGVVLSKVHEVVSCIQAALVAVGPAQAEAAVAGVTRLREGRGGVDGVPPTTQDVGGIQELGIGHGLSVGSQLHPLQADHHLLGAHAS